MMLRCFASLPVMGVVVGTAVCHAQGDGAATGRHHALQGDPTAPANPSLNTQFIDSYDPATNTLSIPLLQVGTAFVADAAVTVGALHSVGETSGLSGVFDSYDPGTNRLFVPVVRSGGSAYFNLEVSPAQLIRPGTLVPSYSVPTDLSRVTYPASYTQATINSAQINRDPCQLAIDSVTYPATWLGGRPLPPVVGAPLAPQISRGVNFKDIGLQPGNPAFILNGAPGAPKGCTGDLRAELDRTLRRLKALGADYFTVTQWRWATNRADGSWTFTSPEETFGALTDADLSYLVLTAKSMGLKVLMLNQIQGFFDRNDRNKVFVPPATMDNYRRWFVAYQAYIAERAPFYQSLGVDMWELGCGVCMYFDTGDGSADTRAFFAQEYLKASVTMKNVFKGKTVMGGSPLLWQDGTGAPTDLMGVIDIVSSGMWLPAEMANLGSALTVESYKAAVGNSYRNNLSYLDRYGKTLLFNIYIQSRGNAFSQPGYMEETACTPSFGSFDTASNLCLPRATSTDFSLQAIVFEATLELIAEAGKTARSPLMVLAADMWLTDSLMPFTAFPNIGTTFRNKPAEGILKAWFAR